MDFKKKYESPGKTVAGHLSQPHRSFSNKSKDHLINGPKKSNITQKKKLNTNSKVPKATRAENIDNQKSLEGSLEKSVNIGDKKASPSRTIKSSLRALNTKPSQIPRRKISFKNKDLHSEEPKKDIHISPKFHIDSICPRNVQQVQLLINQDLYQEGRGQGVSVATTRPLPSLAQIYARNNVHDTDRFNDWFVELSTPVPANSRATNFFSRTTVPSDVKAAEHTRIENKKQTLTVSNVEFDGTGCPRPNRNPEDIISDWLSDLEYPTRDNESGYRSISPVAHMPMDIKSKCSFQSGRETPSITGINEHRLSERSSRKSLDYEDGIVTVKEQDELDCLNVGPVLKKLQTPNRSGKSMYSASGKAGIPKKLTKPGIDSILLEQQAPLFRKPTQGSANIRSYKSSNPGGDGKKFMPVSENSKNYCQYPSCAVTENVQVTVPSYVECPSEILQRTTNFEDMAQRTPYDSPKEASSIAGTDPEIRDDLSCPSTRHDECSLYGHCSNEWCARCRAYEADDRMFEDCYSSYKSLDQEEFIAHGCSRSRTRGHHAPVKRFHTDGDKDKRFPSTKYYLPKTLSMLRRRMSMRQCRRGLSRVWKKTAEKWALWSAKSPHRLRKLRVKHCLQRSVFWEDADVQTSIFIYRETGTCPVTKLQRSVAVSTILKLKSSIMSQRKLTCPPDVNRINLSRAKIIPSMFPFPKPETSTPYCRASSKTNARGSKSLPQSANPNRRPHDEISNEQKNNLELFNAITQTISVALKGDPKKDYEFDSYIISEIIMDDKITGTDDISSMRDSVTSTSTHFDATPALAPQLNTDYETLHKQMLAVCNNPQMIDNTTSAYAKFDAFPASHKQLLTVCHNTQMKDIMTSAYANVDTAPATLDYEDLQKQLLAMRNNPEMRDNTTSAYANVDAPSRVNMDYENLHKQLLTVCNNPQPAAAAVKFPAANPAPLPIDVSVLTTVASNKTCETNTDFKEFSSINVMTSKAMMKCSTKISHIETQVTPVVSLNKISTDIMVSPSFLKDNSSKIDMATDMIDTTMDNAKDFANQINPQRPSFAASIMDSTSTCPVQCEEAEIQSFRAQIKSDACLTSIFQLPTYDTDTRGTGTNDESINETSPSRLLTYFNTGMLINTLLETAVLNGRLNTSVSTDTKSIGNNYASNISTSTKSMAFGKENAVNVSRLSANTNTEFEEPTKLDQTGPNLLKMESITSSKKIDGSTQYSYIASKDDLIRDYERVGCSRLVAIRALRVNESEVQTERNSVFVHREYKCTSACTSQCTLHDEPVRSTALNRTEYGQTDDLLTSMLSKQERACSSLNSSLQTNNASLSSHLDAVKWMKAGILKGNVSQLDENCSTDGYKTAFQSGYDIKSATEKTILSKSLDFKRTLDKNISKSMKLEYANKFTPDKKSITMVAESEHDIKYSPEMNTVTKSVLPIPKFDTKLTNDSTTNPIDSGYVFNCTPGKKCVSQSVGSDTVIVKQDLLRNEATTVASALSNMLEIYDGDLVPVKDTDLPIHIHRVTTDEIDKDSNEINLQSSLLNSETDCKNVEKKSASVYTSRYVLPIPEPCTYTCNSQHFGCFPGECVFVYGVPKCVVHNNKYTSDASSQISVSCHGPFKTAILASTPVSTSIARTQSYGQFTQCSGSMTQSTEKDSYSNLPAKRSIGIFTSYFETRPCTQQTTGSNVKLDQIISPKVYKVLYETTQLLTNERQKGSVSQKTDSERSIQIIEYRGVDVGTEVLCLSGVRSACIEASPEVQCASAITSQHKQNPSDSVDQFTQIETVIKFATQCNGTQCNASKSEPKKRKLEKLKCREQHHAAVEVAPTLQPLWAETICPIEMRSTSIEAMPDVQCASVITSQYRYPINHIDQFTQIETTLKLATCTQYSFSKFKTKVKKEYPKYMHQPHQLEEVPQQVKNLACLSDEHDKAQLVTSCRYFSSLLTKQLGRVKEQLARHILKSMNNYNESDIHPDVCVMKPSAREDLACQTSKYRPGVKLPRFYPLTNIPPTISLTNICREDKGDLKSVYLMLTALEGRMRRFKANLHD